LLDEGRYHGSIRTMYRLVAARSQTGERRRQQIHPLYAKLELLAIRPNEVRVLGHHQDKGPGQMDLLPSLRYPRHLQPPMSSVGSLLIGSPRNSPSSSSPTRWRRKTSLPAPSRSMPIVAPTCDRNLLPRFVIDLEVAETHGRRNVLDDNPYPDAQRRSRTRAHGASGSFIGTPTSTATAESA
jgi:putative transposase